MNIEHDTLTPATVVTYGTESALDDRFADGPTRAADPIPTVHTWELTTFLQHREAVITTARDMCERVDADPGSVEDGPTDPTAVARSLVARIAGEADRIARHDAVYDVHRGEADDALPTPAPDGYERVKSLSKPTRRTRKGSPVDEVIRHGRAVVVGSTTARDPHWHGPILPGHMAMSSAHVANVLATTPAATIGHDGLSVYRATEAIFGDAIPRLLAGDTIARAEFGTWDEVQAVTRRQSRGSNGSTRISWPDRTTVNGPGTWRADEAQRANVHVEPWSHGRTGRGTRWARVTEVPAMTDDGRVWIGHRPARDRTPVKVNRGARAARTVDTVAIPASQPIADGITAAAAMLKPGQRARLVLRDGNGRDEFFGSVTMSPAGRWSTSTTAGKVRGARTLSALRKRLRAMTEA